MRLSKKVLLSFLAMVLTAAIYVFYRPNNTNEHVHYHAGFKVYVDDVVQDYTDYKYMNFVPCSEHDEKKTAAEEQIEKAHLHDSVGDVVHSHREGAVWGDLFKNIGVTFPDNENIVGYINGIKIDNILNYPIKAYDSVVIQVGKNSVNHNKDAVTLDHIKEVEAKSELCGQN